MQTPLEIDEQRCLPGPILSPDPDRFNMISRGRFARLWFESIGTLLDDDIVSMVGVQGLLCR